MGKFIWHEWARFVNIFASVCAFLSLPGPISSVAVLTPSRPLVPPKPVDVVWAGIWGCLFPKFFWDFVRGTLLTADAAKALGRDCTDSNPCGIV